MKTTRAKKTSVLLSTVLDPRGQPTATVQPHPLAPRLETIQGKTVYLVDVGFENLPVEHVSWHGAVAYCTWYSDDYYAYSPLHNPIGPAGGEHRVQRSLGGTEGLPGRSPGSPESLAWGSFRCAYSPQ